MTLLGSTTISQGLEKVAVSGETAYVVGGPMSDSLFVVSIGVPQSPTVLGRFGTASWPINGIAVKDDYVVLAAVDLMVLDVGDPSNPTYLAATLESDFPQDVQISGVHAFVAAGNLGLQVIDISAPADPTIVGQYPGYGVTDVDVHGNTLYLRDLVQGAVFLDVTDPTNPTYLGETNPGVFVSRVEAEGNILCLTDILRSVFTIDVTLPSAPIVLGRMPMAFSPRSMVIHGPHVYIANGALLEVLDIANPRSPSPVGAASHSVFTDQIASIPGFALLASRAEGLEIMDCRDPSAPFRAGLLPARDGVIDVAAEGSIACMADDGLRLADISDPTSPVELSHLSVANSEAVAMRGDLAVLIGETTNRLMLYDISDPKAPMPLGTFDTPGTSLQVELSGRYAFVADDLGGLQILNLDDPWLISIEGSVPVSGGALDLALRDEWVYVVTRNGLAIVNAAEPSLPVVANQMLLLRNASAITIHGSRAYVSLEGGLHILDLSDPIAPSIIGTIPATSFGAAVGVLEETVALANNNAFSLYPLPCGGPSPVTISGFTGRATHWAVELSWHTSFEEMHDGFHVDRSRSLHGGWERLTDDLVRGESPYSFVDQEVEEESTYFYRLAAVDWNGEEELTPPIVVKTPLWSSASVTLENAAPNPFVMETGIRFTLGRSTELRLTIFDVAGRLVRTVASGRYASGTHRVEWNGFDERGSAAAPGTYFVRLDSSRGILTKKVVRTR